MTSRARFAFNPLRGILSVICVSLFAGPVLDAQVWVPKGPAPGIGDFNTLIQPNQPVGGALEAVVAHPTNPNILWVGSVSGGVFRTDDATSTNPVWTPQMSAQQSLSISALELDPTDGTHNTLLAGIGVRGSFFMPGDGAPLTGLLKTTNGGTTWTQLLPSLVNGDISGLAPRGSTVVAALDGPGNSCGTLGIWRSTNGGVNFSQISNGAGLPCGFAYDLASDPTNSARLFTPITGVAGASDGLYRSTNTGATWTQVGAGSVMDTALQSSPIEVQVAVGRRGGASANVFVAVCDQSKLSGLFHSPDAGANWSSLDLPGTTETGTNFGIHPGSQCMIHLSLVADPVDHSVVYIGGDRQPRSNEAGGGGSAFPNSIGANSFAGRLFRVDADLPPGSQATPVTNCPTALSGCGGSKRTANNTAPHADSREMVFDALGDLIETDDGGVYRHTNPSGTNGDWVSVIGNLSAIEQHSAAYDTVSNILMAGNQDNGAMSQISPGSPFWDQQVGGDGGDVAVGLNDPVAGQSTRYLSGQNLNNLTRQIRNSSNGLVAQAFPTLTPVGGSPQITRQFVTPIAVNAVAPTRLILGGSNGVYESFDRLDSITRISLFPINQSGRGPIAYGAAGNADALYFGSANLVFVRLAPPPTAPFNTLPGFGLDPDDITGVVMDPDNAATVFAVDRNSVYGTTNAFAGWVDITGNLFSANPTAGEINSVTYINSGGDRLVVGTDSGVFAATEGSGFVNWVPLGTGLPNALVYDLAYDPQNDLLAAGTMGRGAWTLSFGAACPWERIFSATTLSTPQTQKADGLISLGPALTVNNATGITMRAGQEIVVGNGTTIGGTFTATLGSCP